MVDQLESDESRVVPASHGQNCGTGPRRGEVAGCTSSGTGVYGCRPMCS